MKKSLLFTLTIMGSLILMVAVYSYDNKEKKYRDNIQGIASENEQIPTEAETKIEEIPTEKKTTLSGLGVNINPLNKQTNKAGDIIFSKKLLFDDGRVSNDKAFIDFGSKDKYLQDSIGTIEYWFYLSLKTPVTAPISGRVEVSYFEHTKDWGVNIYPTGSEYIISFEHLVNVKVKEGDIVNVGDVLGEAAPRNTFNNEIAMVELAVWKGGSRIVKLCPFDFLEESLKAEYTEKINTLASEWEEFIGKEVYNQEGWVSPGCLVKEIVEN